MQALSSSSYALQAGEEKGKETALSQEHILQKANVLVLGVLFFFFYFMKKKKENSLKVFKSNEC